MEKRRLTTSAGDERRKTWGREGDIEGNRKEYLNERGKSGVSASQGSKKKKKGEEATGVEGLEQTSKKGGGALSEIPKRAGGGVMIDGGRK